MGGDLYEVCIWGGEAGQGHKNKVLAWMPLPEPPKEVEYHRSVKQESK